jgi:pantothenate kinase-related protein Tda10
MTEEEINHTELVSLLSDAPAEPEQDILDYQAYCDAIVSLIRGLPLGSPFTMGIFGNWGSGKTTLLKMIRSELSKQNSPSIWINVIVQGFFCNFDQVIPRKLFLRLSRTFKSYVRSAGQPLLADLIQHR